MVLELSDDGLRSTWKGKIDNGEFRVRFLFRVVTQGATNRSVCCRD